MSEPIDPTTADLPSDPQNLVRNLLERLEIDYQEKDGYFAMHVHLNSVDGLVLCHSRDDKEYFTIVFRFPMLVPAEMRPAVGEFLHRINYASSQMSWDMDYDDGEVRCRLLADLIQRSLSENHIEMLLKSVLIRADRFSPYLAAVMTRAMTPEFAADQALADILNYYEHLNEE